MTKLVTRNAAQASITPNSTSTLKATALTHAEMDKNLHALCIATDGTVEASKAVVVDASKNVNGGINDFAIDNDLTVGNDMTVTGTITGSVAHRGALVYLTSLQNFTSGVLAALSGYTEVYDTDNDFYAAGSPTRLTVPTGVTKVKVSGQVLWGADSVGYRTLNIYKNGASFAGYPGEVFHSNNTSTVLQQVTSSVLQVTAGDYFEMRAVQTSGSSLEITAGNATWFSIEVIT